MLDLKSKSNILLNNSKLSFSSENVQHSSWSRRLRLYNQFVQGNAELLSISSDDSIWNSEDEEGKLLTKNILYNLQFKLPKLLLLNNTKNK